MCNLDSGAMQRLTEAECRIYIAIAYEQGKAHLYPVDPREMASHFCLARRWTSTGVEAWVVRRLTDVQISPMLLSTTVSSTPKKTAVAGTMTRSPHLPSTAVTSMSPEGVPRGSVAGPITRSRLRQEKGLVRDAG
ncbi:hypothetical protein SDRG_06133 [Saprolegnia diclina VS20]|uniref:Uncharacterized protein n=1 Tax=Saprolegnia diclina (strain VS20) TaxID=1156394 RepID=T0QFH6_SAPDV|nr:hypothetical protein SDRG_06133 [Saprolegnia diclina VS20]EQC36699.1 hypothetical protein SDRG_06133 [Saprolegnia diclina VS20]|eukprot:XP_008610120.1 hypothetical protein SDRG_06133 [Saprolegnia diclina VS20]